MTANGLRVSWLLASGRGVGYLLKSRVTDVEEFLDTLGRIAKGGSVVDPTLVADGPPRSRWAELDAAKSRRCQGRPGRRGRRAAAPP
jgi:hypothetical protein